jgi:hypothetical protein
MKKIILAVLLSGTIAGVYAQTEKNDWLVGGRLDINTGDNSTNIGFSPGAGVFLINNFAFGGNLALSYQKTGDVKYTNFGIGPFVRYYFTNAQARPLLSAAINFLTGTTKAPGYSSSNTGSKLFLGGGVAVFINDNVSFEGLMGYAHTKYKNFDGDGGFSLGLGFQVYLNKRQVERLRGK